MNRHNSTVLNQIPPSLSRSLLNVARNAIVGDIVLLDRKTVPVLEILRDRIAHISLSLCLVGLGNGCVDSLLKDFDNLPVHAAVVGLGKEAQFLAHPVWQTNGDGFHPFSHLLQAHTLRHRTMSDEAL